MTVNSQPNPFEFSEADTCREYGTPAIQVAGWGDASFQIGEQRNNEAAALSDRSHRVAA